MAASGRHNDAALVVLLGDHAYVDAPLAQVEDVAALALPREPQDLLDAALWGVLAAGEVLGPADHFWADHSTALPPEVPVLDPGMLPDLRAAVSEEEWHEAGFDREMHAGFGIVHDGRLVAASVLTTLWGWPVDVGVLVAPDQRGRGHGVRVAGSALAAGVALSGFAAFRVARANRASRAIAANLGLTAYGANLAVPLARGPH